MYKYFLTVIKLFLDFDLEIWGGLLFSDLHTESLDVMSKAEKFYRYRDIEIN